MLFQSHTLGNLPLKNRIVMPPMTRSRAGANEVPTPLMATYYSQRSSAGLIISEGTQISRQGQGAGKMVQHSMPRELTVPEIREIVRDYAQAARNAIAAGFDGVELHGANGYLIEQFIDSQTNQRTDQYGGSIEKRLRFLKEVVTAVADAIGKERVGVRQAPLTTLMGAQDDTPEETYLAAAKLLNEIGIAYIHIAEADWENAPLMPLAFKEAYRAAFKGTLIYAGKYTKARAEEALEKGWADLIAFGRPFIANPDLPERLRNDLPLTDGKPASYFGGGAEGYTDYPTAATSANPTAVTI